MNDTYIKVAGRWFYLYRAVDSHTSKTVDFLLTKPMMGFKSVSSAKKTLPGIELCHGLRKVQYDQEQSANVWDYFYLLAGQLIPEVQCDRLLKIDATEPIGLEVCEGGPVTLCRRTGPDKLLSLLNPLRKNKLRSLYS